MAPAFTSYVLCGTPRSGSTLLCRMLTATGVAGRPNSFFRREDLEEWAEAWGVPFPGGIDAPGFDRLYLDAMKREGSAETGVFGLRLMWPSVAEATLRLNRALFAERDIAESLEAWAGRTLYVHVSRRDKVAQAVSLMRAEQSGLWHLSADGSVLEGTETMRPVSYDETRIAEIVRTLQEEEAAWNAFFAARGIFPLRLVYETVATDPIAALKTVLEALGLNPDAARGVGVPTARTATAESARWIEWFRRISDG